MLAPAWHGVPVAAGRPQRKQSAAVLACSSFLSNKVQREAMLYIKRPKLPLPPHGFHTYEVEYERKTTVTSSLIYLVAGLWLHFNCSSISLLPTNRLAYLYAYFIFWLTSVVFISVNLVRHPILFYVEFTSCCKKHRQLLRLYKHGEHATRMKQRKTRVLQ